MDSATSSSSTPNPRFEWFLLHAGFVVIGVITTSLGPLLPMFSTQWGLSDTQMGAFFPAQYCVSLLGVSVTGWLLPRFGFPKVLGGAFLFLTIGMAMMGISPWLLTAAAVSLNGFGYGLANPTTNLRGTCAVLRTWRPRSACSIFRGVSVPSHVHFWLQRWRRELASVG
jgi:fucose permease